MYTLTLLGLQIVMSLIVSSILLSLLHSVLYDILLGACGTAQRATFWVRFTQINLVLAPLLLVIFFAPVTEATVPEAAQFIRDALFRALVGAFMAVMVIGQVIWRTVKAETAAAKKTALTTPQTVV